MKTIKIRLLLSLSLVCFWLQGQVSPTEKQALQEFYNATGGPNWTSETDTDTTNDWDFSGPVTSAWQGVTVSNGMVTYLSLNSNNLIGYIPESFGLLTNLTSLYLSSNQLTQPIPFSIGELEKLTALSLSNNQLTGGIPNSIGLLINLTYLSINNNQLSAPIPESIGELKKLTSLYLGNNEITGKIPDSIGQLEELNTLNLTNNNISDSIPESIGSLTKLAWLSLNDNQLTGDLPVSIWSLVNLEGLHLETNQLTGEISSNIGALTKLKYLWLSRNQLEGSILDKIVGLSDLRAIFSTGNNFEGNIPENINLLTQLTHIWLPSNNFSGPIPASIGQLANLKNLNLYNNRFSGLVPTGISSLSNLELVYLHSNEFMGDFPNLTVLSSLNTLNFSNNNFQFGDFENEFDHYSTLDSFGYGFQAEVDEIETLFHSVGTDVTLNTTVSGNQNHYLWKKDGIAITGAPDSPTLTLSNIQTTDAGVYTCEVTSDIVTGLTLTRNNINLLVMNQDPGANPGGPGGNPETGWNTITAWQMDLGGNLRVNTRAYFDCFGNPVQNQTFDIATGKIWASSTLYDSQGRPALQSLSAPTDNYTSFLYKEDFIKNDIGNTYSQFDFEANPENPTAVSDEQYSLGWYYSNNNSSEEFQDITNYPFSRTIYSELNPGTVRKNLGGNKINNKWPQGYTFTMRASKELSQTVAFGDSKYDNYKIVKTVSRDVHGNENVVFTDSDGKTLAAARSGIEGSPTGTMEVVIGEQGYVDVHVAQGINTGFTVNGLFFYTVYDLITEMPVTGITTENLPSGFYRVAVTNLEAYIPGSATVSYTVNYYDYSLNEYDKTGRLVASYQPLGNNIGTQYVYNALGQLISTNNTDEGEAKFKYRKDGKIRYSQSSEQADDSDQFVEYSYTNYDPLGRPVESGVAYYNKFTTRDFVKFSDLDPDADMDPMVIFKEQNYTQYDTLNSTVLSTIPGLNSRYHNPGFLSGNVSKTWNNQSTTFYSYDIYGRINWIVQDIIGLGVKTLDYEYDAVTGLVTKVIYQKDLPGELFVHRYTYNILNQLTEVYTSTTNGNEESDWELQAHYTYYETGGLKRTELANGIQGVDYVYNLAGQLKSINHPSLSGDYDPNGDTEDLFGAMIDYHSADYLRDNTKNIKTAGYGEDQLNGNIKGIRWNNKRVENSEEVTYAYSYDRNNWLSDARFGTYDENATTGSENLDPHITDTDTYSSGDTTLEASKSVTLLEGFHAVENSEVLIRIGSDGFVSLGGDYEVTGIEYDANGNIRKLNRNKQTENGSNAMDQLSYEYKPDKPNQLLRVDDAITDATNAPDIKDQEGDNYVYNKIGQLIEDHEYVSPEDPDDIIRYIFNTSGLVTEVSRKNAPLVRFFYNDRNHRYKKESYVDGNLVKTTYYVRDVAGSVLAIYEEPAGASIALSEQPVYGNGRIGVNYRSGTSSSYVYQLTDHLGNVRAVFAKNEAEETTNENYSDYYPFGMLMPGRNIVGDYRYAFQGQEKDGETGKEAFELRLWDGRIGRWLTTDPYGQYNSPYLGMGNNPISRFDPDGGCDQPDSSCGWFKRLFYSKDQIAQWNYWKEFNFDDAEVNRSFSLIGVTGYAKSKRKPWYLRLNTQQVYSYSRTEFYVEGQVDFNYGAIGKDVKFFGTRSAVLFEFGKNELYSMGGGLSTERGIIDHNFIGLQDDLNQDFGIFLGEGLGAGANFNKDLDISKVVVNTGLTNFITEYHTKGVHKGELKSVASEIEFGNGFYAVYGFEWYVKFGIKQEH